MICKFKEINIENKIFRIFLIFFFNYICFKFYEKIEIIYKNKKIYVFLASSKIKSFQMFCLTTSVFFCNKTSHGYLKEMKFFKNNKFAFAVFCWYKINYCIFLQTKEKYMYFTCFFRNKDLHLNFKDFQSLNI